MVNYFFRLNLNYLNNYTKVKILITGASGFIGRKLIPYLLAENHELILHSFNQSLQLEYPNSFNLRCDICDIHSQFESELDVIIHMASAGISNRSVDYDMLFEKNVKGTLKVLELARDRAASLVVLGSFSEYGKSANHYKFIPENAPLQPTYPYAASKAAMSILCDTYCNEHMINSRYLRLFNVYGDGMPSSYLWEVLRTASINNQEVYLSPGEQIRDFLHVSSVINVIISILRSSFIGCNTFNVGSGFPLSIRNFAEHWWATWDCDPSLLRFGSLPYRENEVMRYVPRVDKLLLDSIRIAHDYSWCENLLIN